MNWGSAAEFFAMGGYGLYVWGSFGVTAAALLIETLLARIPACRAVVTTGQKATDTLRAITGCGEPAVGECVPMPFAGRDLTLWRMPSSSRAFPRPVEWKAEFYRKVFSENGIL